MGNTVSEEVERQFHDEAVTQNGVTLESPEADKYLNVGTAAANCQPKHTQTELKQGQKFVVEEGMEVVMKERDERPEVQLEEDEDGKSLPLSAKHRRGSSLSDNGQEDRRKRQHMNPTPQQQQAQQANKKLSYVQMAKLGYQELVNAIIRPPRADYKMEALGPPAFNFCGKRFTRTDFTLRTKRGYNLECSHWEPVERATDRIPVIIYMHGNSSARVEVIPQLSYLLSLGLAVFAFDFAGSGKSDGEYVSLGYYEREDLSCIVAHLRATNVVSTIALWGRSMGAATALMFGDRDPSIACMILDSSFADLSQLAEEMVEKGRDQGIIVPNFVVSVALRMIQGSVKKQAGFNIKHISPIAHSDKCFIPALFVAGEHDDFIKKHHSEAIYEKYAGDKNLIIVEGDHNSPRPKFMFDSASIFLQTCLQIPNIWALPVPPSMNLMCPPWYFEMYHRKSSRAMQRHSKSNGTAKQPSGSTRGDKKESTDGFDHEEMGMTQERQRVIQASLFKMLGQADSAPSPADGGTASKTTEATTTAATAGSKPGS
ncbi:Family with sequence similarity 108, member [Seminavis robusta]|uniref:Family with sequence similarity 108, member n=1 Tax=Seminavis robusta TaxID=568900 RepID=A0A9N8HBG5_9STRA|nr:Family with sequence similarity 108, member [Seminavis robusta]|eukprot:Sro182_g079350.1 Family with sequence similarity 108, member (542) ;mRNA; r:46029-47918